MPSIAWALIDTLSQYGYQTTLEELMPSFGPSVSQVIQQATKVSSEDAAHLYEASLTNYYENHMPKRRLLKARMRSSLCSLLNLHLRLPTRKSNLAHTHYSLISAGQTTLPLSLVETAVLVSSPHRNLFIMPLNALHTESSHTEFVEDTAEDMQATSPASIPVRIGITKIRSTTQLQHAVPTHTCSELPSVKTLLLDLSE